MALFDAPIAHEDHAQRACYASLHLLETLRDYTREVKRDHGLDFAVRIGLNSGEVVVGRIGEDLRMDYTAQGHTVGLAQRMEALAEPNSCALSRETPGVVELRRAEDGIRYRDEEPGEYYLEFTGEYGGLWRRLGMPPQALVGVGTLAAGFDASSYYRRKAASFDPRARFIFEGIGDEELIGDFGILGGGAERLRDRCDRPDARHAFAHSGGGQLRRPFGRT